jgi:hypothetical protein
MNRPKLLFCLFDKGLSPLLRAFLVFRFSVGLEDPDDVIAGLEQTLG